MSAFDTLWREIAQDGAITVQDYGELEYIFNLVKGCKSYLEIGTAEGKSLYVLAHAMPDAEITYIDLGEKHTEERRNHYLGKLKNKITAIHGDSTKRETAKRATEFYDVVFIDAGHDTFSVMSDVVTYGHLAKKYIIFHDVQLPEVSKVFNWYIDHNPGKRNYRIVNSETFGYGVIEV